MKNILVILTATIVFSIVTAFVLFPVNNITQKEVKNVISNPIPENLLKIFKNSCTACHAEGGKKMAMSVLNFSNWDKYTPEKQIKKANAISKEILKGSMPPKSFLESNPKATLNKEEITSITKWTDSFKVKK